MSSARDSISTRIRTTLLSLVYIWHQTKQDQAGLYHESTILTLAISVALWGIPVRVMGQVVQLMSGRRHASIIVGCTIL
jgi:hypothetical protein